VFFRWEYQPTVLNFQRQNASVAGGHSPENPNKTILWHRFNVLVDAGLDDGPRHRPNGWFSSGALNEIFVTGPASLRIFLAMVLVVGSRMLK
jgi:hypothetical protein